MTRTRTIVGSIVLRPSANLSVALVIVTMRDTTLADAPAATVAMRRFYVSGTLVARVPFRMDVPADLLRNRRYTLGAEIRRHSGDAVVPGDYLNMQSVPWQADATTAVEIPVRPIGGGQAPQSRSES